MSQELNFATESEPIALQHPDISESLNIASENTDKKEPEFKNSSEVTLESSFSIGKSTDKEEIEREIKPIPDPLHSKENVAHFTDEEIRVNFERFLPKDELQFIGITLTILGYMQSKMHAVQQVHQYIYCLNGCQVAVNINLPSSNTISSSFQSSTPEKSLEFSMTPVALGSTLQTTVPKKGDDQDKTILEAGIKPVQEKTESKFQSAETNFAEKSVNLGGPSNYAPPLSSENAISVLPSSPKNAPPPVPPKKKSIEMILAEEAKAMGQHSLRYNFFEK
ncbi:hypothetical protein X798_04730 [Onchocerca flexuosa]|uniref:Uncharacterized protein n=1 Tax=Onchocerca flexuosa TaxID=387005 RepID=A0A238BSC4_9BILA|nr:hypothetical protein X798_04730 [Onchocerca flexuosa]